jgi:hypothetical protein
VLRQWRKIQAATAKNLSNEAYDAGKEIEVMKCLTLHRFITSSLLLPSFAIHDVKME